MNVFKNTILFSTLAVVTAVQAAQARDVMLSNDPVPVALPLSQEIRIEFPEMVMDLNIPSEVDEHLTTLLTPQGVLYWKATAAFEKNRAIATTAAGDVILLDLSYQKNALPQDDTVIRLRGRDNQTVSVSVQPEPQAGTANIASPAPAGLPDFIARELSQEAGGHAEAQKPEYSYADLAAFAFQHYLGPARLISDVPATRIKVKPPKSGNLLRMWSDRVQMRVLNGWTYENFYITAIRVRNVSSIPLSFDPRAIRGRFLFAATLREVLEPRGSAADTTIWILISDRPFHKAAAGG